MKKLMAAIVMIVPVVLGADSGEIRSHILKTASTWARRPSGLWWELSTKKAAL